MIGWARSVLLMLVVASPALAEEGSGNQDGDNQATRTELEAKPADSPIQHLAELRIDELVVPARSVNLPLPGRTRTLQDVLDRMKDWAKQDKIGAILLDLGDVYLSLPDIEELRGGVAELKKADKKVMAFFNSGSPEAYLLACAADEIALPPSGALTIPGIGRLFPFMKGYYQMVGLEYEVITSGRYKYPGFVNRREPDKYFTEEIGAILDGWIEDYKGMIAEGRGLSPDDVSKAVDIAVFSATQAQQRGLVDTLAYYDEYRDRLLKRNKMKRYRSEERGLGDVNSIQDFVEVINRELKRAEEARKAVGPKIAVLHARGPIIDYSLGAGLASQYICRDDFVKVVDELRKNKSIKAVVMRVDSPGGSGYASDVIWKQLRRLDETKPLVVSMGSVAGSGGYYISCPGRRIFAQPTTITGSIGVLGIFQSAWSQLNRRDYEVAEMKRGARSMLGYPHRTLSKEDHAFIQRFIDDFYDIFIERVAATRKIPAEQVRKIAEGRIYTGRQALELALVDELGGLEAAIQSARELAEIPPSAELKIVHYPRGASLGELFESFSSMSVEQALHTFTDRAASARPVTFEQQLRIFSRRPQALCWMAVPEFYRPEPALGLEAFGMGDANRAPDPLAGLLQGER
jgi:protease-4